MIIIQEIFQRFKGVIRINAYP